MLGSTPFAPQLAEAALASTITGRNVDLAFLWNPLNAMGNQIDSAASDQSIAALLAGAVPLAATVGFVAWNFWNPYPLASAVAATPMWRKGIQGLDPLAVLESWERQSTADYEPESLHSLIG